MGERNITVSSRFSPSEAQELDRRRGKVRRGTFLRNLFLGKKPPRQIPGVNLEKYIETSRWAANLNQIARSLNSAEALEVEDIRRILAGFRRSLIGLTGDDMGDDDDS